MKAGDIRTDSQHIIHLLKNGEEEAVVILYRLHWKKLYLSSYKILKDREACKDIVQELFIKIWNKRGQLTITSSIEAYLLAAVRYEVYRRLREDKRFEPIVDEMVNVLEAQDEPNSIEYKELEQQIDAVVSCLPVKCKQVYRMSRNELLSHQEIAEKLMISTKTVRNHITHALHRLRVSMHQTLLLLIVVLYS